MNLIISNQSKKSGFVLSRRHNIIARAAAFIAAIICAVLVGCAVFMPLKAFAISSENDAGSTVVDELTLPDGSAIDGRQLLKLYDVLLGTDDLSGSLQKIKNQINSDGARVSGSGTDTRALTAAYIRVKNDNANVYVLFGGIEWEVVYLTYNRDGEVILDLWQSTASEGFTETYAHGGGFNNSVSDAHVSNIYGTSYIRAQVLNGGGVYYSFTNPNGASSNKSYTYEQSADHPYAKFTMPDVEGSLTQFIDTPENIEYQEKQSRAETSATEYNLPNEAYGTPSVERFSNGTDYGGANAKSGYDNWKGDYLWLPSITETGDGVAAGLWSLDATQRANTTDNESSGPIAGEPSENYSWTRSASYINASYQYYLDNVGGSSIVDVNASIAVRPALHLNLTKADAAAAIPAPEASGDEFIYSGAEQTYTPVGYDSAYMTIENNVQTDADEYIVTVNSICGYPFTGGDDEINFKFEIKKATPKVSAQFEDIRPFSSKGFPDPTQYTATYNGTNISGTFEWIEQAELIQTDVTKEYEWTFIPSEDFESNYNQVKGKQEFNFKQRQIIENGLTAVFDAGDKTIYTKTPDAALKEMIALTVEYDDGDIVNEQNFTVTAELAEGEGNELTLTYEGYTLTVPIEVSVQASLITAITAELNQGEEVVTPDTPLSDIKKLLKVYAIWNYTDEPLPYDGEYTLDGTLNAGKPTVNITLSDNAEIFTEVKVRVVKGTYDMSGVTLVGTGSVSYDGAAHGLTVSGEIPNGVVLLSVVYTTQDGRSFTAPPVDTGTYSVNANFGVDLANYNAVSPVTSVLVIGEPAPVEQPVQPEPEEKEDDNSALTALIAVTAVLAALLAGVIIFLVINQLSARKLHAEIAELKQLQGGYAAAKSESGAK